MKVIVISSPVSVERELEILNDLFENGLDTFHLRKPDIKLEEAEEYIRKIEPKYISRIMIHSHYELLRKYNLKGIHLPEKVREEKEAKIIIKAARNRRLKVSTSVHHLEDIKRCDALDYAFLSPVYPSISKPGYSGNLTAEKFKSWKEINSFKTKVVALGGVNLEHIDELKQAGFDGVAILGAVWKNKEGIQNFSAIKAKVDIK